MTSRVFQCTNQPGGPGLDRKWSRKSFPPARGLKLAVLVALLVVPLAGAADPPRTLGLATLSAIAMLSTARLFGTRVRWGWLSLLSCTASLLVPRDQMTLIGPAVGVAGWLSLVLWLANRGAHRGDEDDRPRLGTREREAQLLMGLSGERRVGEVLARELPQDYALINGLKLPRGAGDIDHLVVGPSGVFLLETKTMAGRIVCEADGTWRRTKTGRAGTQYAGFIGDPAGQVQRNIFAVRDCLKTRVPGLFRRTPLWVEGLVVFANPRTELDAEYSRVPAILLDQAVPRICQHTPQRPLRPDEVGAVVDALLVEGHERPPSVTPAAQSAQALVEVALVLPVIVALMLGTVALSRIVQAQTSVVAVAHEAARAGALGSSPADAVDRMRGRVDLVAPGLGLNPGALVLDWDVSMFSGASGRVVATVRYTVDLGDLPLAGWAPAPAVRAEHEEGVDPFRSGISADGGSAR